MEGGGGRRAAGTPLEEGHVGHGATRWRWPERREPRSHRGQGISGGFPAHDEPQVLRRRQGFGGHWRAPPARGGSQAQAVYHSFHTVDGPQALRRSGHHVAQGEHMHMHTTICSVHVQCAVTSMQ